MVPAIVLIAAFILCRHIPDTTSCLLAMGGEEFQRFIDLPFGLASGRQIRHALSIANVAKSDAPRDTGVAAAMDGGSGGTRKSEGREGRRASLGVTRPLPLVKGDEENGTKPFGAENVGLHDFKHKVGG